MPVEPFSTAQTIALDVPLAEMLALCRGNRSSRSFARRRRELCAGDWKGLQVVANGSVVDRIVKVARLGPHATNLAGDLLIDIVGAAVELAHVVAIHDVDDGVFARADGEMTGVATSIHEVRQEQRAAGAKVGVGVGFGDGIRGREIVEQGDRHSGRQPYVALPTVALR